MTYRTDRVRDKWRATCDHCGDTYRSPALSALAGWYERHRASCGVVQRPEKEG